MKLVWDEMTLTDTLYLTRVTSADKDDDQCTQKCSLVLSTEGGMSRNGGTEAPSQSLFLSLTVIAPITTASRTFLNSTTI